MCRPGEKSDEEGDATIGLSPRKIIRSLFVVAIRTQFRCFFFAAVIGLCLQLLVERMSDKKKAKGYKKEKQLNKG